jgi:hypothetical protein
MAYVANAVTLSSTMHALTSSTLKWPHRIQCGFSIRKVHKTPQNLSHTIFACCRGIQLGQVRWSFVNIQKAFWRFRRRSGLLGLPTWPYEGCRHSGSRNRVQSQQFTHCNAFWELRKLYFPENIIGIWNRPENVPNHISCCSRFSVRSLRASSLQEEWPENGSRVDF